jgi:hypothetical protein
MSEENVELARRFFPRIDFAATFADEEALAAFRAAFDLLVHPEFETVVDPRYQMLVGGNEDAAADPSQASPILGVDGFVRTFGEWVTGWDSWVVTPTSFAKVDESRVLIVIDIQARSTATQATLTREGGNLMTFDSGRLIRFELFLDRREALEAAGMSE